MNGFFFDDYIKNNDKNTFVANLSNADSETELLENLYTSLKFPNYFGLNWDALSDCITDLSWINERQIILIHSVNPGLNPAKFQIYISILKYAVERWQMHDDHKLMIFFPKESKEMVNKLLSISK